MTQINLQFTRFSAFYSPLIATISGGFLKEEGLDGVHSVAAPGKTSIDGLLDGTVHVGQTAVSHAYPFLEKGATPPVRHFAQVNETDGFFLTGRAPDPDFTWSKLAGAKVLVDHGAQPKAMFIWGCKNMGLDYDTIDAIDVPFAEMDQAFRDGQGDYIHQQGPAPQQLERDGVGHVVASVGKAVGMCAFSSLAATDEWLETDMAKAFMRAYLKTRRYLLDTPAADIARDEADFFPGIDHEALTKTIAFYQTLGCWPPHAEITRDAFEVSLDVFLNADLITKRHAYDQVVVQPPAG